MARGCVVTPGKLTLLVLLVLGLVRVVVLMVPWLRVVVLLVMLGLKVGRAPLMRRVLLLRVQRPAHLLLRVLLRGMRVVLLLPVRRVGARCRRPLRRRRHLLLLLQVVRV